jgi:hypothetical protein
MQAIPGRNGLILPNVNATLTFFNTAVRYVERGYSVLPLYGDLDADRGKVAAVQWADFQHRQPTQDELQRWFVAKRYPGIAIVTGFVSNLVVLDFDAPAAFTRFYDKLPYLIDTRTVKTCRGHHLYYRLPPGLSLPSRKGRGVDLLSDGKYVVAPPTTIHGWTYKVTREIEPCLLSAADVQGILAFFGALATTTATLPPAPEITPSIRVSEPIVQTCRAASSHLLTDYDLISRYGDRADREGRNEALFRVSLSARDNGWTVSDALDCLVETHVRQTAGRSHRRESEQQRRREAVATIRSAFSRPARPRRERGSAPQVPNSVREALLTLGQTHTLRVIEGLYSRGMRGGDRLTYSQAKHLLRELVGDWSIRHALAATTADGSPIFAVKDPSPKPPTPANAAAEPANRQSKTCFLLTASKPTKSPFHRPARVFILPTPADLCRLLGVRWSGSDTLAQDDLSSAKGYRQALHREFIQRRPGVYARSWLAARLGVAVRTEQRYNRAIPINVRPIYQDTPISWRTLNLIPAGLEMRGTFLEDEQGKRYPPRREIAVKLLSQRRQVTFKRRDLNYYWYGDTPPPMPVVLAQRPDWEQVEARLWDVKRYVAQHPDLPPEHNHEHSAKPMADASRDIPAQLPLENGFPQQPGSFTAAPANPASRARRRSPRRYRKPLSDPRLESLAGQVVEQVNQRAATPPQRISRASARRLVDEYGPARVERALKVMGRRRNVTHPAGWITVFLRSEVKARAQDWI